MENRIQDRIEVRKVGISDISELYPSIYRSVFDDIDPYQSPSIVYLGFKDGIFEGFISGYLFNICTFYVQYAGIIKEGRGYNTLRIFRAGLSKMDEEFPYIMCAIRNDNIVAIKLALNENFLIHGIRMATDGKLYVELLRKGGGRIG